MNIRRWSKESNASFLYRLFNDLGHWNLAISANFMKDGELRWLTRYKYRDLMEYEPTRWLKGTYDIHKARPMTRDEFIATANHRTIHPFEIMIDIDDAKDDILDFESIKKKTYFVVSRLRNEGIRPIVHFTGSKSYHVSFFDYGLMSMTPSQRKKHKEMIIGKHFGDYQLASENVTIALEGARHYKSGRRKMEVEFV